MLSRNRWLFMASALMVGGLSIPTYAAWRSVPPPLPTQPVTLSQARNTALSSIEGGQILTEAPSNRNGQAGYVFSIRSSKGQMSLVWVNGETGAVILRPLYGLDEISAAEAGRIASAAISGSRVTSTVKVSQTQGPEYKVLLLTSSGAEWAVWVAARGGQIVADRQMDTPSPSSAQVSPSSPPSSSRSSPASSSVPSSVPSPSSSPSSPPLSPSPSPSSSPVTVTPPVSGSPITSQQAAQIALESVGGGQVLEVRRSEISDNGQWDYQVKILLPTSSTVKVKVSETGQVIWVHSSSDS